MKDKYLKDKLKFDEDNIKKINEWDQYKYADSIGKLNVSGLKIKFKKSGYEYLYEIPSFSLCVLYNTINVKDGNETNIYNKKSELFSKFSLSLIKKFQEELGIGYYNDYGDNKTLEILFSLNEKYSKILRSNESKYKNSSNLANLFNDINNSFFKNIRKLFIDSIGEQGDLISNFENFFAIRENGDKFYSSNKEEFLNFKGYKLDNDSYRSSTKCILSDDKKRVLIKKNNINDNFDGLLTSYISFKLGYLALNIKCRSIFEESINDHFHAFIYLDE